jgi:uncharacterized protein YqeY
MREPGVIERRMKEDAVVALKAGDKRRREALGTLVAELKKARIDAGAAPSEADELTVLTRERKRRSEALELYTEGERADLAERARFEVDLISGYLPAELPVDELERLVDEAIAATGAASPKEMGKVMGRLMPQVAGRADGKALSELVRRRLGG